MKPIIIHKQARIELEEAIAFYEQRNKGLGLSLQTVIERTVARIQQYPQLGNLYKTTELRHHNIHRFPYVIFYAELEEEIWIVAFAHEKRRPGYWKTRKLE